jgi:hypothetical protein
MEIIRVIRVVPEEPDNFIRVMSMERRAFFR